MNSFKLSSRVSGAVRISPDAERIATLVAKDDRDCGSNSDDFKLSVYSSTRGELLHRFSDERYLDFDWHPDGRLVVLEILPGDDSQMLFKIETAAGTLEFLNLFNFTAPPEVSYYDGFRIDATGTHGVMEAVLDNSHFLSGVEWRNAKVHHFPLFEGGIVGETNLFEYPDKTRVNAPTFSPDGQYILVTEGYLAGAFVSESHFPEIGVNETLLDIATRVPVKADSTSYIVPADMKLQTMPPLQYSETMRPVLIREDGKTSAVGFDPIHSLSWTPVLD